MGRGILEDVLVVVDVGERIVVTNVVGGGGEYEIPKGPRRSNPLVDACGPSGAPRSDLHGDLHAHRRVVGNAAAE